MAHLPQKNNFSENYQNHSHLPISPFYCAKFKKKFSRGSRIMRMPNVWAQKENFFSENLLMSLAFSIHAYLHAKNQSQILMY